MSTIEEELGAIWNATSLHEGKVESLASCLERTGQCFDQSSLLTKSLVRDSIFSGHLIIFQLINEGERSERQLV